MKSLMLVLACLPAEASAEAGQEEKATPKVELKGCMKFEGISFRQGEATKYTGDTYLLRLLFTDERGETFQPTPTLNFIVYKGEEPYAKAQRIVTKDNWKTDAAKISKENVADKTIAQDKKTGELWVAFVRCDFDPRADLTLELKGVGTWVWKGLDLADQKYDVPAKGPDKPAKK